MVIGQQECYKRQLPYMLPCERVLSRLHSYNDGYFAAPRVWFFDNCDGAQEKDPKKTIMSNEGRGLYRLVNNRIAVKKSPESELILFRKL